MQTCDLIYGQKISIVQPEKGFRVCTDTILLSASVQAKPNELVLDVGAGVGAGAICLAYRCKETKVHGIELQRDNVHLASENISRNNMKGRVEVLLGNLFSAPPRLSAGTYDHVMTNPPFFNEKNHRPSPFEHKSISCTNNMSLEKWLNFCLIMVKSQGTITMIYPAEFVHDIIRAISGSVGNIIIFPLWPKRNEPAKRVVISGIKGSNGSSAIMPGLILHQANGNYTEEAENILRYQKGIQIRQ